MKRCLLFILALSFGVFAIAQQRVMVSKSYRDVAVKKVKAIKDVGNSQIVYAPGTKSVSLLADDDVGETLYDLQTNSSSQNRLYLFDDGTMGTVWNMGFTPTAFGDRGTGYNYFDGSNWGPPPSERIEPYKTGWPSYMAYGENGELFVVHHMTLGLAYGIRDEKGTGDWTMAIQAGPPSAADISWPRGTTTGPSHNVIHFISVTYGPSGEYNDQSQALLYSRSADGGETWDIENQTFEELGPDYYEGIGGDSYEFAESKDGQLAFLVGDNWMDLCLMKSEDDGDTWTKTVIWECPYPLYTGGVTDAFYCPDGAHSVAFDQNGKLHVVFGINRAQANGPEEKNWYPLVGGIGYWNEDRPTFSSDTNALCPYSDCEYSELVEDYSLIGWSQDLNDNDTIDIEDATDLAKYYLGLSSMPQLTIDDQNQMFVVYSSVTEGYTGGLSNQTYRHLWSRFSPNGDWWGEFTDLTSGLEYVFDECVYPSVAAKSDEYIYLSYQADEEPGLQIQGDEDPPTDCFIRVMSVLKTDLISGVKENNPVVKNDNVSQNYPNPFNGTSRVYVLLEEAAELSLEVHNMMGQLVYSTPEKKYNSGKVEFTIDGSNLESGIYFYSIVSGESSVTKKMIIE